MSWNTCRHPECENWTYRPDVDYCETHRRANAKEEAEAKKQVEKRTTLIAKQREKGKQPRKTISKVSHKREKINKEYYKLVEQFKKDNPKCNAKINQYCTGATEDPHHSRGRGKFLLDVSTWIAVCRSCHTYIENHPADAQKRGLSFSRLETNNEESGN
jgi:hypothetical protein